MRLWWHLDMGYQEVSYQELQQYVSPSKMARLDRLFDAMADRDYDTIDAWADSQITEMEKARDR
jgi:hypothetical protein